MDKKGWGKTSHFKFITLYIDKKKTVSESEY